VSSHTLEIWVLVAAGAEIWVEIYILVLRDLQIWHFVHASVQIPVKIFTSNAFIFRSCDRWRWQMQATGVGTLVVWRRGRGRRRILTKNLFVMNWSPQVDRLAVLNKLDLTKNCK
jgi:hypothetical protein